MSATDPIEKFVRLLTEHQNRLYGYVFSLLGDHSRAADVVQETNLVLWRKIEEFQPDRPFLPWAIAVARFQVMAHLRDRKRDRCLLDTELVELLSDDVEREAERIESTRLALRKCLQGLTTAHRQLIERRYFQSMSISDLADSVSRSAGSVKVALLRVRRELADCVEQRLAAEN